MRTADIERITKETRISLSLNLDGGDVSVETGLGFFDHMLTALFFYAGFGARLTASGDLDVDAHHTVEDVGIVIGRALAEALGDRKGIRRYWSCQIPMDEALCSAALDVGGRAFLRYDAPMPQEFVGGYDVCLTPEFMRAFAVNAAVTLHMKAEYGDNSHHVTEALFKALGTALRYCCEISGSSVASTKGVLS
ncbi:MAG: imidazoleglycerol-phosphate dehydratase HisB [Clostridiales bacterium]|jgi:imidazoleglycerol-phosphate dehydratase|nr:imidazoleglycerol-phosphate dehydratase HisB [Clostridiales bacterium]